MHTTHFLCGTILLMGLAAAVPLEDQRSASGEPQASFTPQWVQDAIFYQIFPERFANGDRTNDPPGTQPWGGKPTSKNYLGGDLKGIIDHLDYISSLGINALYLNPIFESNSNHKYHATDYLKIDPAFGDEKVFKKLVNECHKRGIRIILDGVFNHTGTEFFAFKDIKQNGAKSKYLGWYNIYSLPLGPPSKPNYEAWWGYGDLPKLMTHNPDVRNHLFRVTEYWMNLGIDGWRLDVPNEIPHQFWIEWRKHVKALNPDAYIVGEIWDNARSWLKGDQFDAVMNYRFRNACLDFFVTKKTSPREFDSALAGVRSDYAEEVSFAMQNLLGSHDTERLLTLCNGDKEMMKLARLFQMTYVGAPMVYYGDEIGMAGGKDPACRGTMIWDEKKQDGKLLAYLKGLIQLRNTHRVLRRGTYEPLMTNDKSDVYAFVRRGENDAAVVALNRSGKEQSIELPMKGMDDVKGWNQVWLEKSNMKLQAGATV
ncbi:MAG: glycoside hydrolase family 13 protein, partial [Bacteroidota bacterium]